MPLIPDIIAEVTYELQCRGAADLPAETVCRLAQYVLQSFVARGVIDHFVVTVDNALHINAELSSGPGRFIIRSICLEHLTKELAIVTDVMMS